MGGAVAGAQNGERLLVMGVGAAAHISPMSIALPWDQRSVWYAPGTLKWKSATRCLHRVSTYVADASTFARGITESMAACAVDDSSSPHRPRAQGSRWLVLERTPRLHVCMAEYNLQAAVTRGLQLVRGW